MIAILDKEQLRLAAIEEIGSAIDTARAAQPQWAARRARERQLLIRALRHAIAEEAEQLARLAAAATDRPLSEKLVSEVLPLLDACRFLERNTARILRPKRHGRAGRPLWLHGHSLEVHRRPFGVVLIVGPRNYPLFIPAVQMLHALAAGNAVLLKPAEGAAAPLAYLIDRVLSRAGRPADLVQLLPEEVESARTAVNIGVDKVVFTGSSENGRRFMRDLAMQNTPGVMELSGGDTVYVLRDADVQLAARAIAFGLRLNAGNTCMAPHAVMAHAKVAAELRHELQRLDVHEVEIGVVESDAQALEVATLDPYGLGAAVFSRGVHAARAFAEQLGTGFVTINDIIVPTADPRLPFGGTGPSGFGVTRGAEGLLEMTYPQAISTRRARFLPHLEPPQQNDDTIFTAWIQLAHGRGLRDRAAALVRLGRAGISRRKETAR
jgi:acyl-CoA reductase-like NAD-dependent aldehyde dehydrogenase